MQYKLVDSLEVMQYKLVDSLEVMQYKQMFHTKYDINEKYHDLLFFRW